MTSPSTFKIDAKDSLLIDHGKSSYPSSCITVSAYEIKPVDLTFELLEFIADIISSKDAYSYGFEEDTLKCSCFSQIPSVYFSQEIVIKRKRIKIKDRFFIQLTQLKIHLHKCHRIR